MEIRNVLFAFVEKRGGEEVKEIVVSFGRGRDLMEGNRCTPRARNRAFIISRSDRWWMSSSSRFLKTSFQSPLILMKASIHFNLILYTSLEKDLADKIIERMGLSDSFPKRYYRDVLSFPPFFTPFPSPVSRTRCPKGTLPRTFPAS